MTIVAEHSVDLSILPENATILDAGCRGFEFTEHFRNRLHNVLAIDIDKLYGDYLRVGLSTIVGKAAMSDHADPQARSILGKTEGTPGENEIPITTIGALEKAMGSKFDLIKLDIEGEEYEILKTSKHPLAKQVSVEFHAHCGTQTKEMLDRLLDELSKYYTIHNKVWESRHGCSPNYWDILMIAK